MPDITLCEGKGCPLKERCYRAQAEPNPYRQSYFMTVPWDGENCEYFWPIESRDGAAAEGEDA